MNNIVELGLRGGPAQAAPPPPAPDAIQPSEVVAPPPPVAVVNPSRQTAPSATSASASSSAIAPAPSAASRAPAPDDGGLAGLVDWLLVVLRDGAPVSDPADESDFVLKIDRQRDQFARSSGRERAKAIDKCLAVCEGYLQQSRRYVNHREKELIEIIDLLRRASTQMAGDSSDFNAQVIASSERVLNLSRLDDIRDLKQRLSAEVSDLRMSAVAKQKRDREAVTQLTERVETLQSNLARAEEEASIDALTMVSNRGGFDRALRRLVANARRGKTHLTLAMLDIDHFKAINDTHGHPVGDRVILCTAQAIQRGVRKVDMVARYGGEEFAVLMQDARADEVEERFKILLAEIAASTYRIDEGEAAKAIRFTISCGLAELDGNDTEADLVRRADEALYEAKRKGRNRVAMRKKSMLSRLFASGS